MEVQPIAADLPFFTQLIVGGIALLLSVMLVWWAALIVHAREANFLKSLFGALGIMFSVLAFMISLNYLPEDAQGYYPYMLGAMILLQILVLRVVFQTSLWKAAAMWVLNVVMILIVYSLFIMSMAGGGEGGVQQSRLPLWRPV